MHLARASAVQAAFFDEASVLGRLVGVMRDQWITQVLHSRYLTTHSASHARCAAAHCNSLDVHGRLEPTAVHDQVSKPAVSSQ